MNTKKEDGVIVGLDVAEHELARFAEAMDLDLDTAKMDKEDKDSLDDVKRVVLRAIQRGKLMFNDNGEPTINLNDGNSVTFKEPTGANFMAMDRKRKNEDVGKMYATMAEMAGCPVKTFAAMPNRDLRICTAVVSLFLA